MNHTHLAGIIPVAGLDTDYDISTPEVLLPVEEGFTAIQKSVYECALGGCQTIWIVANMDLAPIVRKVVGEWTYDPVYYNRLKYGSGSEARKEIPIYYVPIHPKDRERRDSYGWSILNGVYSAWRTANHISKWIIPEKYFISFPMGVHNIHAIRQYRKQISDPQHNFFMSYDGKTVLDNLPLSFTLKGTDYIKCRRDVNQKTTKEFFNTEEGEQYPTRRLPLEERWSAKHFTLAEVFEKLNITDSHLYNADWFYDISTWAGYREYLASEYLIKKPANNLTKARQHVKIPYIKEEEE